MDDKIPTETMHQWVMTHCKTHGNFLPLAKCGGNAVILQQGRWYSQCKGTKMSSKRDCRPVLSASHLGLPEANGNSGIDFSGYRIRPEKSKQLLGSPAFSCKLYSPWKETTLNSTPTPGSRGSGDSWSEPPGILSPPTKETVYRK